MSLAVPRLLLQPQVLPVSHPSAVQRELLHGMRQGGEQEENGGGSQEQRGWTFRMRKIGMMMKKTNWTLRKAGRIKLPDCNEKHSQFNRNYPNLINSSFSPRQIGPAQHTLCLSCLLLCRVPSEFVEAVGLETTLSWPCLSSLQAVLRRMWCKSHEDLSRLSLVFIF